MEYERDTQSAEPLDREAPPPVEWLRLTKYLLGELDAEGCREVERWIASGPVQAPVVALLRKAWRAPVLQEEHVNAAAVLARVMERIQERKVSVGSVLRRRSRGETLRRSVWYGAAAVAVVGMLAFIGWAGDAHHFWRRVPVTVARYATANGQRGTVTLADGSTVMLNVASQLEVPTDYAAGNRTVRLVGEALITVSHQGRSQFTVITGPTVTRVLGTSFVVRRYGTDALTTVIVRDGKVAVNKAVVTAGQMVEVGPDGVARAGGADASQFDFGAGVLVLRSMTLSQAIPELNRWYDADVRLGDVALATRPIKGYVTAGSLADLAERLTVLFDVRVVREGRVLTLYPR